jgi:hypothetical protein
MPRRHLGVRAQSRAGSRRRHQIFMNGSSYRPNERCGRVITPKATSTRYNSHTARTWGNIRAPPPGNYAASTASGPMFGPP